MIISIVLIAIALFLAFGLTQASKLQNIHIHKRVTIQAHEKEVFDMVKYLRNFPKWSPFLAVDPDQKYEVKGTDGNVGAQYHWEGNKGKDLGYQEIVKLEELKTIGMRCDIQKPFKANPTFDYSFEKEGRGVAVTQDFRLKSSLIDAFFMWLFGARRSMEQMNERGMNMLKQAVEM